MANFNTTPVELKIDGFATREVLMVDYKFAQATDREGQISGIPRGGRVNIRVKALNDGNNELIQWMLEPSGAKDFQITYYNTVDGSVMKTLKGTCCYCINFKEHWADKDEHYEEIMISCQKLENGQVSFDNPWK
jgi:hypothetical protein